MTDTHQDLPNRLDSWKAIASYLDRDERTVQRWERELALPVRRLPGRGRSVFAYTSEIDEWLRTAREEGVEAEAPASPPAARTLVSTPWRIGLAVALVVTGTLAWRLLPARASAADVRMRTVENGVVAVDARGSERWTYAFAPAYATHFAEDMSEPAQVVGGDRPAVYLATAYRARRSDDSQESGTLTEFDLAGREQRSFSFTDTVTVGGVPYGPPWVVTMFAVNEAGGRRRIAIAAHHAVWDAGLVTVLDEQLHRHGTFVHAGWIEQLQWLAPDRLLIGGFSNAHDGGMVALLDPSVPGGIDGQGPEPRGSRYFCESCGTAAPLRMAVMPRTELNRVTASRFNRARIQTTAAGVLVRTIEVPLAGQAAVDVLYEFTPALDLVRASFGDHYWDYRRALELGGTIRQGREQSSERDGPRAILMWDSRDGWTTRKTH